MAHALIINPAAGGVNKRVIEKVKKRFGNKVTIYYTSFNDGEFDIPGFDSDDFEITGIMGGDGTLNDCINLILKDSSKTPTIGWIPRGTGNGYLRAIENPKGLNESIETLLDGEEKPVDLIHMKEPIDVYALNFLDIGAIARILEKRNRVNEWTKKYLNINSTGILGYVVAILSASRDFPQIYVKEASVDDKEILSEKTVEEIVIGKGYTPNHFPVMGILQRGELDDGNLRIGIYEKANIKQVLGMLFQRQIDRKDYVGRDVKFTINGESPFQADGNLILYEEGNYHIVVEPNKIKMVCKK